jgi:hypothetical protein
MPEFVAHINIFRLAELDNDSIWPGNGRNK